VDLHGIEAVEGGFSPQGRRIFFRGRTPGHAWHLFAQDLGGGTPEPISPEGLGGGISGFRAGGMRVSPDGAAIAAIGPERQIRLYPVAGGDSQAVRGALLDEDPIQWSADGRSLYVARSNDLPARVYRVDVENGRRELWKEIAPSDRTGVYLINNIVMTRDARSYAYSVGRLFMKLCLVDGLR
jgi:hypothetical protein